MSEKILIASPTRGMVSMQWAQSLRALRSPQGVQVDSIPMSDQPFDHLRNALVKVALQSGYDRIFFVDDDVQLPPNALVQLHSRNLDIVSGLYMRRHMPIRPTMALDGEEDGHPAIIAVTEFPMGRLLEVDYVGAGCLLIKRNVLETLKNPWFLWQVHREDLPAKDRLPEDLYFCRKAREAGFQIHMDTSVRCLHLGMGKADLYAKFTPAETPSDALAFGAGPLTGDLMKSVGIPLEPASEKVKT